MSRLSREKKRELQRAEPPAVPVAPPIDVRVSVAAGGGGAGTATVGATVGGVPVTAVPGEEIQHAVLDHLHRIALATGHPVLATVHDDRIGYVIPLEVGTNGASRFAGEPTPAAPQGEEHGGERGQAQAAQQAPRGTAELAPRTPLGSGGGAPVVPAGSEGAPVVPQGSGADVPLAPHGPASVAPVAPPGAESAAPAAPPASADAVPPVPGGPGDAVRSVPRGPGDAVPSAPGGPEDAVPAVPQRPAEAVPPAPPARADVPPPPPAPADLPGAEFQAPAGPAATPAPAQRRDKLTHHLRQVPAAEPQPGSEPQPDAEPVRDAVPTFPLRAVQEPTPLSGTSPTFPLRAVPEPVDTPPPGTAVPRLGEFGPPPQMDAPPRTDARPTPVPAAPMDLPVPEPEPDPKPTPARGFDAVAEAVLGDNPPATGDNGGPALLAGPMARINEAVKAGRIDAAAQLAERTVSEASGTLGAEHPEVLRLRELTAYIAYLAGDPLRSFRLSLDLVRIRRRTRDAEAAYGNIQSAAAAWRAVRDPEQGLSLGRDLIGLWSELTAEEGPAADDIEQLEKARARMGRLTERARTSGPQQD